MTEEAPSKRSIAVERVRNPVPRSELERRWNAVRNIMKAEGIDALVVGGSAGPASGYLRWFTGQTAHGGLSRTAIFPVEGLMTIVEHGGTGGKFTLDGNEPLNPGVGKRLTTPAHMFSVNYTTGHEAELIAGQIRESGFQTIGLVHPGGMYHGVLAPLKDKLANFRFVDTTDAIDLLISIKSEFELGLIRKSAAMQDSILEKLRDYIKPGQKDFEVIAYAEYLGTLAGSTDGTFQGCSAPQGFPAPLLKRPQHGRELRAGDTFNIMLENNGPGSYYTEIMRTFVLGKASQEMKDGLKLMTEAQKNTLHYCTPGTKASDVYIKHNEFMAKHGLPPERRLHSHSQGYALVERPLVRPDETMTIEAGMNWVAHPSISNEHMFVPVCDNYIIGPDGPGECIHKTPQEIIEL